MIVTNSKRKTNIIPGLLEFIIVITASLGYFIYSALQYTHFSDSDATVISYGDAEIIHMLQYESAVLVFLFLFLKFQGRNLKDLGFSVSIDKITHGLILFIANYIIYLLLFRVFGDFLITSGTEGSSSAAVAYSINLSILPLILFSIINPIFEEFILVGYIASVVGKRFGLIITLITSVFFRLSFHVYQGPLILLSILPMGILFTVYFWHKRSIVPLIIGHGVMDFLSFYVFMLSQNTH